jgi:hypothetical protein
VERREAHAHVHGATEMSFVIDRDRLLVELAAPMGDMVGFDAPKNAADRMKIDQRAACSTMRPGSLRQRLQRVQGDRDIRPHALWRGGEVGRSS